MPPGYEDHLHQATIASSFSCSTDIANVRLGFSFEDNFFREWRGPRKANSCSKISSKLEEAIRVASAVDLPQRGYDGT
jgi:hypothetical protein